MKSQSLQQLVKKIFGDEKTRLQFISDPESVISQYSLTEQEKKAVLNTYDRVGLVSSSSSQLEAAIDPNINWFAPVP
jgi:hypothetical protein